MTSCLTCTGLIEKGMSWFLVPNSVLVSKPNLHNNTLCRSWLDSALLCPCSPGCARLQGLAGHSPCALQAQLPGAGLKRSPAQSPLPAACGEHTAAELCWGKSSQILNCMPQNPRCVCLFSSPAIFQEQLSTQIALSLGLKAKQTQLAHTAAPSYERVLHLATSVLESTVRKHTWTAVN